MMINSHNHSDYSEEMKKCQDYIHALEEERTKIQVFQRELPLCLDLVTQAIETCKQQLSGTTTAECNSHGKSECSQDEQTSTDVPVLEEFMPIKRADSAHNSDHGEQVQDQSEEIKNENSARYNKDGKIGNDKNSKKSDWLKSVQLWNQTSDPPSKQESPRKSAVVEVKKNGGGGAFHPFKKEKSAGGGGAQPASTSSTAETGGNSGGAKKEEKEGQSERKARRCWSPELHRRFLQALQQLGGAHVGTPKQIRELMKVDGLTNDEVKSHLQKYRLHTRRPSTSSTSNHNNNTQTPQFVVVGGIWMQPEYVGMATNTTSVEESGGRAASKKIYAPVAAPPPPPFREAKQKPSSSHSDDIGGGARSYSPAASSSTHTTTASLSH